jgi:lipoprotein-anchoring transpeptidase ErfK/SrfK
MSRGLKAASSIAFLVVSVVGASGQYQPPAEIPYSTGYGTPYPADDDDVGLAPTYPVGPDQGYGRRPAPVYRQAEPPDARSAPYYGMPRSRMYDERSVYAPPVEMGSRAEPPASSAAPVFRPPGDVTGSPADAGAAPATGTRFASLPPDYRPEEATQELPAQFRRQVVSYRTNEPAGTIVVDTANTHLYYILGDGQAVRYGIGVGRDGFTWSGRERISRMAEWPDWHPPSEMLVRQPDLPRFMAGGEGNPLGARALYLGKTLYRIHGTNQPSTIGKFVSSGCIRMLNADVEDLFRRVRVGTEVVVVAGRSTRSVNARPESLR